MKKMNLQSIDSLLIDKFAGEWGTEPAKDSAVNVIRTTNFTNEGKLDLSNVIKRNIPENIIITKKLKYGDIILEKSGGSDNRAVGRVVFYNLKNKEIYLCNNFTQVLRINKNIANAKYILYCLLNLHKKGITSNLQNKTTGIRNLQTGRYLQQSIPIPDLPIQHKITQILEKAESAIEKRKQASHLTDEFIKSTFLEMFGDPIKNPKNWKICKVIDVTKCIVPGRDKPKSFTGNIPWITTDDLNHLGITCESKKNIGLSSEEISQVNARIIPKDSVVMTCVGDLGVVSILGKPCVMNQQLHAFICSKEINNIFLMHNLSWQKPYMYKMATSTTVSYMNKTICNSVPIILPKIDLQQKFAEIVQKVEKLKHKQHESEKELNNLFNSLMQRAFRGDLL